MNEDYKKTENSENKGEVKTEVKKPEQGKSPSEKQGFFGLNSAFISAAGIAIFVVLYAVINISSISSVLSNIMSVLSPVIIGAGMAYLLNPVMNFFERKVFKKIKNKKLLRGISIVSTYLASVMVVAAVVVVFVTTYLK